jgi:hypothetical protein
MHRHLHILSYNRNRATSAQIIVEAKVKAYYKMGRIFLKFFFASHPNTWKSSSSLPILKIWNDSDDGSK